MDNKNIFWLVLAIVVVVLLIILGSYYYASQADKGVAMAQQPPGGGGGGASLAPCTPVIPTYCKCPRFKYMGLGSPICVSSPFVNPKTGEIDTQYRCVSSRDACLTGGGGGFGTGGGGTGGTGTGGTGGTTGGTGGTGTGTGGGIFIRQQYTAIQTTMNFMEPQVPQFSLSDQATFGFYQQIMNMLGPIIDLIETHETNV